MDDDHTQDSPGDALPPAPPAPPVKSRGGRRCCAGCLVGFVLLAIVAGVGNYFRQKYSPQLTTIPLPGNREIVLPGSAPVPHPPGPKPHELPRDLTGVLRELTPVMAQRFRGNCEAAGVSWPPQKVRLVGLKAERKLEVWVANADDTGYYLLKSYTVLAASGAPGPKRRKGDEQVPEGHYKVVYFNPKSKFHLSMLLDYPNAADKAREAAALAKGVSLGGDICIHGSSVSIGCLAIGDGNIEEVFTLMALASPSLRDVVIAPADFRQRNDLVALAAGDLAVIKLYQEIAATLNATRAAP